MNQQNNNNKKGGFMRDIGFYIIVLIVLLSAIMYMLKDTKRDSVSYAEVVRLFRQEKVAKFWVTDETTLVLELRNNQPSLVEHKLYSIEFLREDIGDLILEQAKDGRILEDYSYIPRYVPPWWLSMLPYVFLFALLIVLWYFMFNRTGGGGMDRTMKFGRARTRLGTDEKKKVTFADVAGAEEEKAELQEIVEFLKAPAKFIDIGARIPKGVLLVGPPGTGKTLLAKAVSGEAGCQFLSISGSDFVELYVGVGASRVRDLFEQAKKVQPCIVFIDEIDAVGRHRGAGMGGGHDEREQTLNQLLVEMDGFGNNEGIIILAATNRRDILDPALLRPGRFDREVYVGYPDIKGREAILNVHKKGKKLAEDVVLGDIAKTTAGFTGADLENLLNEAALLAARENHPVIFNDDIANAMLKVIAGPEKRSKVIPPKDLRITAYHEAGHAVVTRSLKTQDPVHHITIIPRGMAAGMTISIPQEDRTHKTKNEMYEDIVTFMGGRVAEQIVIKDITGGAVNDIQRATKIARDMVTKYGMSDNVGAINFANENDEVFIGRDYGHTRAYSEQTASMIDNEIKSIIDQAYQASTDILNSNLEKLHDIAKYLLAHETMDGTVFEEYFTTGLMPGEA
ncbi:MAG: ATP-dependent zinc metalloprotease FtsH [Oscillospiraceae bacterium]|nr:ATP-dependent zinc metalloprotease FtsH [Oscillospiraceae bacterium]